MVKKNLFGNPETIAALNSASAILASNRNNELRYLLGQTLRLISSNAALFDENSQINIGWIGDHLLGELNAILKDQSDENVCTLATSIYRFIVEYDFSEKGELTRDIRSFMSAVQENIKHFSETDRQQIQFAKQEMPIAILKRLVNSEEIINIRGVGATAERVNKTIQDWEATLKRTEETTVRLAESLEKHTKEFNFVGLREGFADLASQVESELSSAQKYMIIFGLLAILPSAFDLGLTLSNRIDVAKMNTYVLTLLAIGTVSITALILYYFRIVLRKVDSCTAQLTQLRLRMSLCRFIQSYADYSKDIKAKNADALSKFEALIFSGLVGSEDKLPSTFDGIEQLTAFAKSITGK